MTRIPHGNAAILHSKGDCSPMTNQNLASMSTTLARDIQQLSQSRPSMYSHHSSSMPSTPYQQPRELNYQRRSPSPTGNHASTSPRSTQSESGHPLPSARRPFGGCKYETGMAFSKRRVPYTLGTDKLGDEKGPLKAHLEPEEEKKLSGDMRFLYNRLYPSSESEKKRKDLVKKLEHIFNKQWPGHVIKVNVFGSTGNNLSTNDSDTDICITTDFKDLEHVCMLADLLASNDMKRVVCVSSAKVPIVKIWDPILELACDINVNNPIALENTRMIKTYVQIDDRVRELAMIIKYWTKRRILNDAALGGTLSSYTWICMIIHFLQNRNPPILPALQQRPALKKVRVDGLDVSFDDDLDDLRDFGAPNKETPGELLFQFFRYYGHELDYEKNVVSIRLGKLIPKVQKGWHRLQDNRLCVEEPFNTSRNLGNTADDTSVRGIHLELRRAFDLLCEGDLGTCCEQFEHPTEDASRVFERPVQSRPVQVHAAPHSGRGGRGPNRGGRNTYNRGGSNSGRRASSASTRGQNSRWGTYGVTPQEMSIQAQHQQYMLHDHLFQQFQILQQQEQELRMQLQQQTMHQPRHLLLYPHLQFPQPNHDGLHDENVRSRAGTVNHPPLTAPIRSNGFGYGSPLLPTMTVPLMQGRSTNPPSPSIASAVPERHSFRRTTTTNGLSGGSLRAQSQPARPMSGQLPVPNVPFNSTESQLLNAKSSAQDRRATRSPPREDKEPDSGYFPFPKAAPPSQAFERRPSEYIGYYVGGSPSLQPYSQSAFVSPLLGPSGLAIRNGGMSPYLADNGYDYGSPTPSPPPESFDLSAGLIPATEKSTSLAQNPRTLPTAPSRAAGPLIIDGSQLTDDSLQTTKAPSDTAMAMSMSTSASDEAFTPTTSDATSQDLPDALALDSEHLVALAPHVPEPSNQLPYDGREGLGILQSHPLEQERSRTGSVPAPLTIQATKEEMTSGPSSSSHDQNKANGQDKASNPVSDLGFSQAKNGGSDNKQTPIQSPGPFLSPVKEVRTPSPTTKRSSLVRDSEYTNGAVMKAKAKPTAERPVPAVIPQQDLPNVPQGTLTTKQNGAAGAFMPTISNGVPVQNGWQTQKKRKGHLKRASANDIGLVSAPGGQILPLDESLRKGG